MKLIHYVQIFAISRKCFPRSLVMMELFLVQKVNFYKVEVCKGSSSCVTCGALPDVPNDKWSTSECPQNAEGDTIKITITRKGSLRFCELQINGKGTFYLEHYETTRRERLKSAPYLRLKNIQ